MAQYEQLPIYKKAMDLAVYVETIVRGFPRYHKYTIGSEMRALSHKILVLVVRANSEVDKRAALAEAREKLEELKILARITMELKAFSGVNSFECLIKMIFEVAGQNEGWLRSLNPRPPGGGRDGERACVHGAPRPPGATADR
ncbi:MAG: four helix bundle protein [Elusimicrobia bacterium]|nr:four helix bundle protein [Elusimicrobiota bacterium]